MGQRLIQVTKRLLALNPTLSPGSKELLKDELAHAFGNHTNGSDLLGALRALTHCFRVQLDQVVRPTFNAAHNATRPCHILSATNKNMARRPGLRRG